MSNIEDKNQQVAGQGASQNFPKYEKNFGHQFEENLASALKEKLSEIVEETELATSDEDTSRERKTDIWVKFWGIDDPIALQITFTTSNKRMDEKEEDVLKNPLVKKEKRTDALIQAPRSCNKVLVSFDKKQVQTGMINEGMLASALRQIMAGLPNQSKMLFIKTAGERMKKAGKKFPT
ncbi:MAG: hypothetical protein A3J76_04195 [Candidatus Moranbacteria bacterium RBG_13_45_13]|nr:MAG: hypothetical protein A3J76_04195 [Candidatus Moranbacteria bacterium RBG_13_45_13]